MYIVEFYTYGSTGIDFRTVSNQVVDEVVIEKLFTELYDSVEYFIEQDKDNHYIIYCDKSIGAYVYNVDLSLS